MRKPYKNPNSNARFATAGSCVEKFKKRGVKFFAPQNAGFFATKFDEAEFCGVKFHKAGLRRARFYGAEFVAKDEKFCGAKRRGAGA